MVSDDDLNQTKSNYLGQCNVRSVQMYSELALTYALPRRSYLAPTALSLVPRAQQWTRERNRCVIRTLGTSNHKPKP
jgi:hypothetical protein